MKMYKYSFKNLWLSFFVLWNINLRGLFNTKTIPVKEQLWYYLTPLHIKEDKRGVIAFSGGITLKVNAIVQLEFELVYPTYPTPPHGQGMTQGQFFKRSLTGLNSEFSFS